MWRWDQGHLQYCQFDAIRRIAEFLMGHDFKSASRDDLLTATGLSFAGPSTHSPWRQYSRVLKLSLLIHEIKDKAVPTSLAVVLAKPGAVTSDEYFHFIAQSFTDPSPALREWSTAAQVRFPLLFSMKYLLAKCAVGHDSATKLDEIISAFEVSNFSGHENQQSFAELVAEEGVFALTTSSTARRQAKESLQVLSQISYFHLEDGTITLSLDSKDALEIFESVHPVEGVRAESGDLEIARLADLFRDGSTQDFFDYPNTVVNEVVESGFREGSKVKRTHVTIERNRALRKAFFAQYPSPVCHVCSLNTKSTYPWTGGLLDLHHLLPLASGTRVTTVGNATSTTFADLVAVCPSCHRAVHRFYDTWLRSKNQADFQDTSEARAVYQMVKSQYGGAIYG